MDVSALLDSMAAQLGADFFAGVPDSLLSPLCDELLARHGLSARHVVAANEGGAVALAAGHYLATGHPGVVYLQNSGIGNAINPICSLIAQEVYAIPALLVVGWRGEPGTADEPQHVFQGKITQQLLGCVDVETMVVEGVTDERAVCAFFEHVRDDVFPKGRSAALLVRRGALSRGRGRVHRPQPSREPAASHRLAPQRDEPCRRQPHGTGVRLPPGGDAALGLTRERVAELVAAAVPDGAAVISTTGKLSRELFEVREARDEGHESDFLTVGSMGHASMIALGVALARPRRPIVALDGDGALIMHAGALAIIGAHAPGNLLHVLVNNGAHESVGGMPTASSTIDYPALARAMGYRRAFVVSTEDELSAIVSAAFAGAGPTFVEARANTASRDDLGRPTVGTRDNGEAFMKFLAKGDVV